MAADKGHVGAICNYAHSCDIGNGIPVYKDEAITYYKKEMLKEEAECIFNLGIMLSKGDGVPSDKKMAFSLFKKAAELG